MKRDWSAAREKLHREGRCRVCGTTSNLQAAHTIGRAKQDVTNGSGRIVKADSIVPLCRTCHEAFDARQFDLLPYLNLWEQLDCVEAAGGIELARRRLIGGAK